MERTKSSIAEMVYKRLSITVIDIDDIVIEYNSNINNQKIE